LGLKKKDQNEKATNNCMKNNKLVKVHQNILIFRKGSK